MFLIHSLPTSTQLGYIPLSTGHLFTELISRRGKKISVEILEDPCTQFSSSVPVILMTRHRHLLQTLKEILTRAFVPPTIPVGTTELKTRGGIYLLCAGIFRSASHLMPTVTLWCRYYHPYLADEKPPLQQDQLICPLFKHWWKVKLGFRITYFWI